MGLCEAPLSSGTFGFIPAAVTQMWVRGLFIPNPERLGCGSDTMCPRGLLGPSRPREYLSVGFVGCLLSFHDWICPLSLGLIASVNRLHVVGDSGLEAGGRCQPPRCSHQSGHNCSLVLPGMQ